MATELRHRCDDCGLAMTTHCDRCDWQVCKADKDRGGCGAIWSAARGFRRTREK